MPPHSSYQDGKPQDVALAAALCFAGELAVSSDTAADGAMPVLLAGILPLLRCPAASDYSVSLTSSLVAIVASPAQFGACQSLPVVSMCIESFRSSRKYDFALAV